MKKKILTNLNVPLHSIQNDQQKGLTMYSSQNAYLGLFNRSSLVTKEQYSLTVRLETQENADTHTNSYQCASTLLLRFVSLLTLLLYPFLTFLLKPSHYQKAQLLITHMTGMCFFHFYLLYFKLLRNLLVLTLQH